jgi:hypothetical protein
VVETGYNIMFGVIGLLIISIFGGGALLWLIFFYSCDLFTLLFKISYFICGAYRLLI